MLNEVEIKILSDIYELNMNAKEIPEIDSYNLIEKDNSNYKEKWSEFSHYLIKLRSLGYIQFPETIFISGGWQNQKYKNNVISIVHFEKIKIRDNGIEFVEKLRETSSDKVKNEMKKIGTEFYRSGITYIITAIIVALATWGAFFWK